MAARVASAVCDTAESRGPIESWKQAANYATASMQAALGELVFRLAFAPILAASFRFPAAVSAGKHAH